MRSIHLCAVLLAGAAAGAELDIRDFGASEADTNGTDNTAAINRALAALTAGDTVVVPAGRSFRVQGGIYKACAEGDPQVHVRLDGRLEAAPHWDGWPLRDEGHYADMIRFEHCSLRFEGSYEFKGGWKDKAIPPQPATSFDAHPFAAKFQAVYGEEQAGDAEYRAQMMRLARGLPATADEMVALADARYPHLVQPKVVAAATANSTLEGSGLLWWLRYIFAPPAGLRRPNLFQCEGCTNVTITGIEMRNSPNFHLQLGDVVGAEIGSINIQVESGSLQPEFLNTDGIDVSGTDVYVHDCRIFNEDDSVVPKPCNAKGCRSGCTQNMLFERLELRGFGAAIGSVPPKDPANCVRNITMRDVYMPQTGKGVYVKSNPSCGPGKTATIQDVLYEDFKIESPLWWAVWIGPQQQHEPGSGLGDKCALVYPIRPQCPTQGCVDFRDITLRNVHIHNPLLSPGVILGNATNPIRNLTFDNVDVQYDKDLLVPGLPFPLAREYKCEGVEGFNFKNTVDPKPVCS